MNRAAGEPQRVAKLILQIPPIGKVQRLVDVREQRERRRSRLQLRHVVEASRAAAHGGRVVRRDRALENRVQLRGAKLSAIALDDLIDLREDLLDVPSGLGGDEQQRRV